MWFPAQVALAREVTAAGLTGADAARAVTSVLYLAGAFVMLETTLAEHADETRGTVELWQTVSTIPRSTRVCSRGCARAWIPTPCSTTRSTPCSTGSTTAARAGTRH